MSLSNSASPVARAVTMADVARAAGVTKMAVSYALSGSASVSEKTRERVVAAARELGYLPNPHARSLSQGRARHTIGLFNLRFDAGTGARKIQMIQSAFSNRGLDVQIHGAGVFTLTDEKLQAAAAAAIRCHKPRALICYTYDLKPQTLDELRLYQQEGGVLVAYDYPSELECDTVVLDREDNTYQATKHLLDLGHTRVAYADFNCVDISFARFDGFRRALDEANVEFRPAWLLEARHTNDQAEAGAILARRFLNLKLPERPSSVCILNDITAMAFITELARAGVRCPDDVSVIGHDDHILSRFASVPLSSVSHPTDEIAHEVIELALSRIAGFDGAARHVIVRGELKARQSSAQLKH